MKKSRNEMFSEHLWSKFSTKSEIVQNDKKRPFSRVLSLKNGLFLVEVRRLELRASWSQTQVRALFLLLSHHF